MLTPEQIVDALTPAARAGFSDLFYKAQIDTPTEKRVEVKAITDGQDDRQALIEALDCARDERWLHLFIALLVDKNIAGETILNDYYKRPAEHAKLHAMLDPARGYGYAGQIMQGFADAMRFTAKVIYNNKAKGTGVLIGPDLVLTAWHVLEGAFDRVHKMGRTEYQPRDDAASSITFEFDDVLVFRLRNRPVNAKPIRISAADKWHVRSSPCHAKELDKEIPANRLELENLWDYVIVRLATAPGLERRWATLSRRSVVPETGAKMYILQHPGGSDLKADDQELGGPEDFPESGGHPNIRFIHYVNSDEGSSGAPCFDKSFSLFGIHQGTWPHPPAKSEKANRGIAVTSIFRHVDTTGGIPPPDPENVPVWNLADDDGLVPAIGRQEFQRLVWSAASTDDTRILVIRGGDQSGKSYLLNMLDNMLPDALHAKVEIFSETLTLPEGTAFVDKICRLAHAAIPAMQTPEEFGQSRPTWREAIIKKLVEALEAAHRPPGSAESRMTWLLFRDMNKPETYGLEINELISLLCEAAAKSTGLRIVLDGFEGSLSQEANRMAKPYTTTLFTAAEIEKFLLRVNAEYGLGVETAINGWVEVTMDEAGANATNKALADKVTAIATAWARKKKKKGP